MRFNGMGRKYTSGDSAARYLDAVGDVDIVSSFGLSTSRPWFFMFAMISGSPLKAAGRLPPLFLAPD